jgi:hypothetical protein
MPPFPLCPSTAKPSLSLRRNPCTICLHLWRPVPNVCVDDVIGDKPVFRSYRESWVYEVWMLLMDSRTHTWHINYTVRHATKIACCRKNRLLTPNLNIYVSCPTFTIIIAISHSVRLAINLSSGNLEKFASDHMVPFTCGCTELKHLATVSEHQIFCRFLIRTSIMLWGEILSFCGLEQQNSIPDSHRRIWTHTHTHTHTHTLQHLITHFP